jgi:hypothetical protein
MNKFITRFFQSPKRLLLSGSVLLCFLSFALVPATALAATQRCTADDVKCVIQFGDQQITNRITALNRLSAAITEKHDMHAIDDTHADALQADVKTNIDGLNTLKTTLDAETDARAARQDVEKIYTQFRIYAVVLPRDRRRLHLAVEITVYDKLNGLKASAEKLIDNAPADKKDELNQLFTDFKSQLSDAESKIDLAQQTWPLLTPNSYNTDRPTYTTNLENLTSYEQTAHTDLHKAAADLHKIRRTLKLA